MMLLSFIIYVFKVTKSLKHKMTKTINKKTNILFQQAKIMISLSAFTFYGVLREQPKSSLSFWVPLYNRRR